MRSDLGLANHAIKNVCSNVPNLNQGFEQVGSNHGILALENYAVDRNRNMQIYVKQQFARRTITKTSTSQVTRVVIDGSPIFIPNSSIQIYSRPSASAVAVIRKLAALSGQRWVVC